MLIVNSVYNGKRVWCVSIYFLLLMIVIIQILFVYLLDFNYT